MKKYTIAFLLSLQGVAFFGQNNQLELPNMALPSPQASEITKFGNIPVDECSGRVSPSISLFSYNVGKISLPIGLQYSGNGVKVEQKPTWTGINWILNAGGVITRTVKDLPDETNKPRLFYSESELNAMLTYYATYSNTTPPYLIASGKRIPDNITNDIGKNPENADSEADDFSFSFGGYSGSFFLRKNANGVFEAKQTKFDTDLKIEILGSFTLFSDYEFKITTPDGTSYFFGGFVDHPGATETGYAVEESQLKNGTGPSASLGTRAKTSFYLTKIENYLGDKIFLEYYTKDIHEVFISSNTQVTQIFRATTGSCPGTGAIDFNVNPVIIKNILYNAKFLKQIWNLQTGQKVVFNSFEAKNNVINNGINFKFRVLSSIDYDYGKIDLEYLPTKNALKTNSNKEKFFLNKVSFKNADNTKKSEEYVMEYNDPQSLPVNTFSYAQDFLGYYNGKINNSSLLPKNSISFFGLTADEIDAGVIGADLINFKIIESSLGDRSSVFEYASKGVLSKITYPTGGSTLFDYEPVEKDSFEYGYRCLSIYNNRVNSNPVSDKTDYVGIGYDPFVGPNGETNLPDTKLVYKNSKVKINLFANIYEPSKVNNRDCVYIKIKNVDANTEEEKLWFFPTCNYDCSQTASATLDLDLLKNTRYLFQMGFRSNVGGLFVNTNPKVDVAIDFMYPNGINDDGDGGGIRIKRVSDYTKDNANPTNIKRFYYRSLLDLKQNNDEIKVGISKPRFHSFTVSTPQCADTNGGSVLLIHLNTNSFNTNLPSNSVMAIYPNVTTSLGGDNFEQGAIEKSYTVESDQSPIGFPTGTGGGDLAFALQSLSTNSSNRTNNSVFNGKIIKETYWGNQVGLHKLEDKNFYYYIEKKDFINNISGEKMLSDEFAIVPSPAYFGLYNTNSYKISYMNSETKTFTDPVPITAYTTPPFQLFAGWQNQDHDGDGIKNKIDPDFITPEMFAAMTNEEKEAKYKRVINKETISYYPDIAGLPSSIKTNYDNTSFKEIKKFYPISSNVSLLNGLFPHNILAYTNLEKQNRIDEPIQVETYDNQEKLSTERTLYEINEEDITTNKRKVQLSKGNATLEERINYDLFYKGNPVQISLSKSTKVVYVWSYQRKPIYKIVNSTYQQVMNAINSGNVFNPTLYNSNTVMPVINENPFITLLPNAQATIYNYDPLTQLISSVIDPKGNKITYNYDSFGRLQNVKDKDGNTLSENQYNYKQ
jgi:YD repeat-containing protein